MGRRCACGALSKRQRGGGEGQKDVAGVGARLLEKCDELNRSASRRVASEFTNSGETSHTENPTPGIAGCLLWL